MNDYFSSVWTTDNGHTPAFSSRVPDGVSIESVNFTAESIYSAAKNVKAKTTNPDGFTSVMMKKLCIPMSLIFNSFMSVGRVTSSCLAHCILQC